MYGIFTYIIILGAYVDTYSIHGAYYIYIQYNYMYILSLFNKTFMIIIYIVINITLYVMI